MKSLRSFACLALLILLAAGCAARPSVPVLTAEAHPGLYDRAETIYARLLPIMGLEETAKDYRLAIAASMEVNAFVDASQDIIVLNRGLLEAFDDERLAFVVAHELAHVKLSHYAKRVAASYAVTAAMSVVNVFVPGAGWLNLAVNPLSTRAFSREQEKDADREATLAILRLGYGKDAAIGTLKRLQDISQRKNIGEDNRTGLWDTHPSFDERIAAIEALAAPETPAAKTAP